VHVNEQLTLDVDAPPVGEVFAWCGIPDCDCGAPKIPDVGWHASREKRMAEREYPA
jgi:hypothetical protein